MNRRDRRTNAESSSPDLNKPVLKTSKAMPAKLYEAGFQHLCAGRTLDAQICCQQALAIDPNYADILHLMGLLCMQAQHYDQAVEWVARAVGQNPRPVYFSTLGTSLQLAGRLEEAFRVFDKGVQIAPGDAELWRQLGCVLAALGRRAEALSSYQHALALNPRHREAAFQSGILLHESGRSKEALAHFNLCDEWRPNQAATHFERGRALRGLKRFEECLADHRKAHALDPTEAATPNNIGDALLQLDRPEEALPWFDKALALRPDYIDVLINQGFALIQLHRLDEAFESYRRAEALDPSNAKNRYHLAHLHLLAGNYDEGWAAREARWGMPELSAEYPKFKQSCWLGQEVVEGKTVLVRVDEGFGDTIQFGRYAPLLAARGARVILVVQDALQPLMSGIPGVAGCIPVSTTALPPFDMHCPTMSLPLAFGTTLETIPSATYLPPIAAERINAWEDRLGPHDRLRVGLVWSGNPDHLNDRNRSMPLQNLTRLLDLDATFVSLQKNPRPNDKTLLRDRTDIVDLTDHCTDFVETAALISCLDLVITVCTSVAHLAGTLGKPTWVLLPYVPDWRWLLNRDDSPWYPTVRLFRQNNTRDYSHVVDRVRTELMTAISKFTSNQKAAAK